MQRTVNFLISLTAVMLMCVVLLENSVSAQEKRKRSPGGLLAIALRPNVQNEIGIQNDAALLAKLDALREVILKEQQELIASTKGDRDQYQVESFRSIDLKHRDELKQMLSAEQYQRVQQITWRVYQYRVLTDPEVVDSLELKSEQVKEISAAQRDNWTREIEYTSSMKNLEQRPSNVDVRRGLNEINAIYHKKIEEILSKQQLDKFAEMQGKPLK